LAYERNANTEKIAALSNRVDEARDLIRGVFGDQRRFACRRAIFCCVVVAAVMAVAMSAPAFADDRAPSSEVEVKVNWNQIESVSKTTPTLQVVVNPLLRRGSPIHDQAFEALRNLQADYVRYVPWYPYPKLGVAELKPPTNERTFWDFSLIDPLTEDFLDATAGHSVVLNFSTIPQWMFKTDKPVNYPSDPDEAAWNYEQGSEFRDPSMKEVSDYLGRLVSWYTLGGFTDELGQRHESGHHYKVAYWEILNEPEYEHAMTPQMYTRLYDAAVTAIRFGSRAAARLFVSRARMTSPARCKLAAIQNSISPPILWSSAPPVR